MNMHSVAYFAGGVAVGTLVGYFVTRNRLEKDYVESLEKEIQLTKTFREKLDLDNTEAYTDEVEIAVDEVEVDMDKLGDFLKNYQTASIGSEEPTTRNIWVDHSADFDEESEETPEDADEEDAVSFVEAGIRIEGQPYIISQAEYEQDYENYDKLALTFFEADDTLVDDHEVPVRDVDGTVGTSALTNFGLMSNSKSLVYVRNEELKADIEVSLDRRSYLEAGLKIGAPMVKPAKFRDED